MESPFADENTSRKHPRKSSVRVGNTAVGKGIFARRRYSKSDLVGEIIGEVLDASNYGSDYCFDIGDGQVLEPASPFRFVNHSCEPNCEFDFMNVCDPPGSISSKHIYLFATTDIKPGEELTISYNWQPGAAIPCRCNAPSCRGWIVVDE